MERFHIFLVFIPPIEILSTGPSLNSNSCINRWYEVLLFDPFGQKVEIKNGKNLIFNSTRNSNLDFRCCIGFESSGFRRFYCLKFVDSSSRRLQRLELIFHEEKWPQRNFCCWKKSGTFYWYAMDWCRTSITGMYLLVFRLRRPCMQPLGGLPLARQPPGRAASGQAASTVDNI